MADWEVALDKQLATFLFMAGPRGKRYFDGYAEFVRSVQHQSVDGERLRSWVGSILWRADPIYVTPEMMTLLEAAWPTFEPEPVNASDLIVPAGFVYLPRSVTIQDARGLRMAHRAIGWAGHRRPDGTEGVTVATFSLADDPDDEILRGLFQRDPTAIAMSRSFFGDALSCGHVEPIDFGESVAEFHVADTIADAYDPAIAAAAHRSMMSFLQALWRLLGQRVAVGFRQRPARHQRKRSDAAKFPEKYITVVTLRRPRGAPSDERHPVEWHMRWIVSGHWRWQPYGDGSHRQIWIAPYVKGPDDKPLVVRGARVFRWAR